MGVVAPREEKKCQFTV